MLEIIDYKDIKRYKKYITTDINNNSYLYFERDLIHKILFHPSNDLEDILKKLDELNKEELVEIRNLIYEDNNVVGYSVKKYKEYKSLKKLKSRPFDLKKQDSIKLVNIYSNILDNGLSYRDFHLGNVLLNQKTNDIKICDLDSFNFFESWEEEKYALENLLTTVLEYLYNIKYKHIINSNLKNTLNQDISIESILEVINSLDSELIKIKRKEIIEKSKERIKAGYAKFY